MKTTAWTVLIVAVSSGVASAQPPVQIDDLRAPTSPAFVLLDVAPAAVDRPENPKAFTTSLISTVSEHKGLPQNYALEVAPYWLTYHPQLTFEKYQTPGLMSAIQTFSISVATTPMKAPEGSTEEAKGSRVGIGLRTNLLNGRFNPKLGALVKTLADNQMRTLDADSVLDKATEDVEAAEKAIEAARAAGGALGPLEQALAAARAVLETSQKALDDIEAETQNTALEIQALDAQRIGFIVSLAAGKTWDFPDDDFDQRQDGRWGVWVTPAYRFMACAVSSESCQATFDAIAVLRTLREPGQGTSWDVGGRVVWQPNQELSLSVETLRRRRGDSDVTAAGTSNRTTAMLEYRINADLSLYGSFGRDFEQDTGRKPLVSLVGLNVGLGKKPQVIAN
jgi:hypothetical protein